MIRGYAAVTAGIAAPFIILWLRHKSLRERVTADRAVTTDESAEFRRRGRLSIAGFVLFWVVTLSLILAVELLDASPGCT